MRKVLPIFSFILLITISMSSCSKVQKPYKSFHDNLSNAELSNAQWVSKKTGLVLGAENQLVENPCKTKRKAIRLDQATPFGLNYKIRNVKLDEFVSVEVTYCGSGEIVLVASHKNAKYFYRKSLGNAEKGDEQKTLRLELSINPLMDGEDLNIYVWNPGKGTIYVDDFRLSYQHEKEYPSYDPMETMHIYIDTLDIIKLERKRKQAFSNGILETSDKDYVDGILFYKDTIIPIDLRLKGDWLDHLEGRKWSFRIKVKQAYTWHKIRTFSIHTPLARDFMNEWMAHELYRDADVLAPRYGFVPVTLNGRSLGIYAWEEHFEKQLVESLDRREGPILKFSEDHFWTTQRVFITDSVYWHLPFLQAAQIHAFRESKVLNDTSLAKQFTLARNLIYQYKNRLKPVSEIFDLDKLAAYYALMDLTRGFHGLAWHNQRFYYNPVLCRLEPIFFDAYTNLGVYEPERSYISGADMLLDDDAHDFIELFNNQVFKDKDFLRSYVKWLERITAPEWLDELLSARKSDAENYEELLKKEFPEYEYDREFLVGNAAIIREKISGFKNMLNELNDSLAFYAQSTKAGTYKSEYNRVFTPQYVSAYVEDTINDHIRVQIRNYWPADVWVVGAGGKGSKRPVLAFNPRKISAFVKDMPDSVNIEIPLGNDRIFLFATDQSEKFMVKLNPYKAPVSYSPEQFLKDKFALKLPGNVKIEGNHIVFEAGSVTCNEPVVIPSGYFVEFKAGVSLNMIKGSLFLSWSPVQMSGTADYPVKIYSSDNEAGGFSVLQAGDTCRLKHVDFSGLNTLNYKNWSLTGAVNFYESDVIIDSCLFEKNVCEDALNVIRSYFFVHSVQFRNTFADAFDSDFCTGRAENLVFKDIGNDAIDFSGSNVDITNCDIENVGDKGVSCGEKSELRVINTRVTGAHIAYASKDMSSMELKNCHVEGADYGLVVFQKKPEFGPAVIYAKQFTASKVDNIHLVELMSVLRLNNTIINGSATSVAKLFY